MKALHVDRIPFTLLISYKGKCLIFVQHIFYVCHFLFSQWSDLADIYTHPSFSVCSLPASFKRIGLKTIEKRGDTISPITSLWGYFLDFQGQIILAEIRTHSIYNACPHYLQV